MTFAPQKEALGKASVGCGGSGGSRAWGGSRGLESMKRVLAWGWPVGLVLVVGVSEAWVGANNPTAPQRRHAPPPQARGSRWAAASPPLRGSVSPGWEEEDGSSRGKGPEGSGAALERRRGEEPRQELDLRSRNPASMFNVPSASMDMNAYSTNLETYNQRNDAQMALATISEMREVGYVPNLVNYNQVIQVCGVTGSWREALEELRIMRGDGVRPSLETYAFAILSCHMGGQAREALELVKRMELDGLTRSPLTFELALESCIQKGSFEVAEELLALMEEDGYDITPKAYELAAIAHSRGRNWEGSVNVLHRMVADTIRPSPAAFHAAIEACVSGGELDGARELLESMDDVGIPRPDQTISVGYIMRGCAQMAEWRTALDLLERLKKEMREEDRGELLPQVLTFAISSLERAGLHEKALGLIRSMAEEGVVPEAKAYHEVMNACANIGDKDSVIDLFQSMRDRGVDTGITAHNALLFSFVGSGDYKAALELLAVMEEDGLDPNIHSYNSVILCCAGEGKTIVARALLEKTKNVGLVPNIATHNAYLSVLAKAGMGYEARDYIQEIIIHGAEPDVASFALAIRACVKLGLGAEALDLLEVMQARGLRANGLTYANVIRAHLIQGTPRKALSAMDLVLKVEEIQEPERPDGYNLPLLLTCQPFIAMGEWDTVRKLIKRLVPWPGLLDRETLDMWKKVMEDLAGGDMRSEAIRLVEMLNSGLGGQEEEFDSGESAEGQVEGLTLASSSDPGDAAQ